MIVILFLVNFSRTNRGLERIMDSMSNESYNAIKALGKAKTLEGKIAYSYS